MITWQSHHLGHVMEWAVSNLDPPPPYLTGSSWTLAVSPVVHTCRRFGNFFILRKMNHFDTWVLTSLGCDYATLTEPLVACLLIVSMKGYMHLSDPMKRYVTTLASHGNNLKDNMQKNSIYWSDKQQCTYEEELHFILLCIYCIKYSFL